MGIQGPHGRAGPEAGALRGRHEGRGWGWRGLVRASPLRRVLPDMTARHPTPSPATHHPTPRFCTFEPNFLRVGRGPVPPCMTEFIVCAGVAPRGAAKYPA